MRHRFEGHLIHKRWVAEHSFGNYQRVKMFLVEDGHRRTGRLAPHRSGEALVMRMRPNIGAVVVLTNQVHGPGWGRSAGRCCPRPETAAGALIGIWLARNCCGRPSVLCQRWAAPNPS